MGAIATLLAKKAVSQFSESLKGRNGRKPSLLNHVPYLKLCARQSLSNRQTTHDVFNSYNKLKNHSILSGIQCLADFANFNYFGRSPHLTTSQKSQRTSISLEQGALLGTAKGPSQPRPCRKWQCSILEHNHMDQNQEPRKIVENPFKPLCPCFWFLSKKVCKFRISSLFMR